MTFYHYVLPKNLFFLLKRICMYYPDKTGKKLHANARYALLYAVELPEGYSFSFFGKVPFNNFIRALSWAKEINFPAGECELEELWNEIIDLREMKEEYYELLD